MSDHWDRHARAWKHVRPPLRPSQEDVSLVAGSLTGLTDRGSLRILLLGVTPELANMPLPAGSTLIAAEQNEHMIEHAWPKESGHRVVRATWQELPFDSDTFDVVVGDGCFTTLATAHHYQTVANEVARVLAPGGRFIHRFFVRPPEQESTEAVLNALDRSEISSLELFKWRFAMSLVDTTSSQVDVGRIWDALRSACGPDLERLRRHGYPAASIATLKHYEGSEKIYSFPPITAIPAWMGSSLHLQSTLIPRYELGERCPITIWIKTASAADAPSPLQP